MIKATFKIFKDQRIKTGVNGAQAVPDYVTISNSQIPLLCTANKLRIHPEPALDKDAVYRQLYNLWVLDKTVYIPMRGTKLAKLTSAVMLSIQSRIHDQMREPIVWGACLTKVF